MRNRGQHPSDDELLLAAEVETGRRAHRVQSHLKICPLCRTRVAQMENALIDFKRTVASRLDPELPSTAAPRAALRARLAELSTGCAISSSPFRILGRLPALAIGAVALVTVVLLAALVTFRHSTSARADHPLTVATQGILPNHALTPGAAQQASLVQVCSLPHEEVVKTVPPKLRQRVFAEYGIPIAQAKSYEVDYLITPGLGGDDNIRNLWPEPYNVEMWNAHTKDILEERLHEMVCSHQLDLSVAQKAISTNWIAAFQKYVRTIKD